MTGLPPHGRHEDDEEQLHDPFGDDQAPFLHDHNDHQDEQESFIDATADSYNHLGSRPPRNPFADNMQDKKNHDGITDYDSFDSEDDDDGDGNYDSDASDSDFTSSEDEAVGHLNRNRTAAQTSRLRNAADEDDYDLPSEEQEDTQHLLLSSTNTRLGGMCMGMRVGETGTGTMMGLDLAPRDSGNQGQHSLLKEQDGDDQCETLPLSTFDVEKLREKSHGTQDQHPRRSVGTIDESKEGTRRSLRSHKGRKGRRKHRSSNAELEGDGTSGIKLGLGAIRAEQVAAIAKRQFRVKMLWSAFYVIAWYSCSTALSFYNKWLFSPNHYNFPYPLFTTSLHMVAEFLLAFITLALLPALRPTSIPSAKDFGTKIMPCATASGLDIGLSNSSLKTITLAFYTMCKSSSLAFVLLFAFAFKLEKPTWSLVGVITVICVGLFMMVMSEVDFVLIGFIQVMLASVLGALRWSLTQLLLEKSSTKSGSLTNPISTIFFLSPIMGICLSIVAGIFEGYGTIFASPFFASIQAGLRTLGLLFLGGLLAFMMVLAEFILIARTSVVSLSVLGIIKEVFTILISAAVFHDHLTLVNVLGLFVTLTGIGVYNFMKLREMRARSRLAAKELAELEEERQKRRAERRDARRLARKEKKWPGSGSGSGSSSKLLTSGDGGSGVGFDVEMEQPWNHSLALPADAEGKDNESIHVGFVLDDDDDDGDFAQHSLVNKK